MPADDKRKPVGHVGDHISFVMCDRCRREWVITAMGVPPSMDPCGCPDEYLVMARFSREGPHPVVKDVVEAFAHRRPMDMDKRLYGSLVRLCEEADRAR